MTPNGLIRKVLNLNGLTASFGCFCSYCGAPAELLFTDESIAAMRGQESGSGSAHVDCATKGKNTLQVCGTEFSQLCRGRMWLNGSGLEPFASGERALGIGRDY